MVEDCISQVIPIVLFMFGLTAIAIIISGLMVKYYLKKSDELYEQRMREYHQNNKPRVD